MGGTTTTYHLVLEDRSGGFLAERVKYARSLIPGRFYEDWDSKKYGYGVDNRAPLTMNTLRARYAQKREI